MTFMVEISPALNKILKKLVREYAPEKVILFGSYAGGTSQPGSDLDLLIIKRTQDRFIDRWVAVRRILSDPERTIPIETLVLTPDELSARMMGGDQFLMEILEKGQVLYAA
jgi:uncharacterized protein